MTQKGREEFAYPRPLGYYLTENKDGRVTLSRGRFRGAFLDTIPKGYIGQFLLTKCRNSMTPKEIELCEQFAGDSMIKKIRRKIKMIEKNKIQVQVTAGKGLAEAFDKAAEHGCSEISLTIPVPKNKQKPTALDRLRTRGTPLELISSYLAADDAGSAQQAFRSSVLEHVYERLAEAYSAKCVFDQPNFETLEDTKQVVQLLPPIPGYKEKHCASIIEVYLRDYISILTDDLQATILSTIQKIGEDVLQEIDYPTAHQRAIQPGNDSIIFGIIPTKSQINFEMDTTNICAEIHISGHITLYIDIQPQN